MEPQLSTETKPAIKGVDQILHLLTSNVDELEAVLTLFFNKIDSFGALFERVLSLVGVQKERLNHIKDKTVKEHPKSLALVVGLALVGLWLYSHREESSKTVLH